LMMSLWDALRMNMMISYQELVRTFPKAEHCLEGNRYPVNSISSSSVRRSFSLVMVFPHKPGYCVVSCITSDMDIGLGQSPFSNAG
ncbi:hypothetical protein, partial [Klebsiella pneumoniae]|uniref:hypothetical protein n=1 Tax=Klebsiella pneumoniae TaxID=573 RepID=UPI003D186D62